MNNKRSLAKEITEGFEALKSMRNNEPVAWIDKRTNKCVVFINTPPSDDWIPLYTHPVKELTDEEISEVITKIANNNEYVYSLYEDFEGIEFSRVGIYELCKAILKKAQEK
jgi:hypothetical protein